MNGCGWLLGPPQHDSKADALLQQWSGHNESLKQLKGVMRLKLSDSGRALSGRAAWAAAFPDRMRVELLSFLGQPLMKLAANGMTIAFDVNDGRPPYRIDQTPGVLEKVIDIPIGVADLLNVMKGCPPEVIFAAAQLQQGNDERIRVVLLNRWHQRVAELQASVRGRIQEMIAFGNDGNLIYRVVWKRWTEDKGYTMPKEIEVVSGKGERLSLEIDRFFFDTTVSNELFEMDSVNCDLND